MVECLHHWPSCGNAEWFPPGLTARSSNIARPSRGCATCDGTDWSGGVYIVLVGRCMSVSLRLPCAMPTRITHAVGEECNTTPPVFARVSPDTEADLVCYSHSNVRSPCSTDTQQCANKACNSTVSYGCDMFVLIGCLSGHLDSCQSSRATYRWQLTRACTMDKESDKQSQNSTHPTLHSANLATHWTGSRWGNPQIPVASTPRPIHIIHRNVHNSWQLYSVAEMSYYQLLLIDRFCYVCTQQDLFASCHDDTVSLYNNIIVIQICTQ